MNKNQKMLLGVAVVGVAAYYYWKSQQPKAAFVGANGSLFAGRPDQPLFAGAAGYANFKDTACMCHTGSDTVGGQTIYKCGDGVHLSASSNGPCKGKKAQQ
jgi:hypothetical protein